MKRFFGNSDGAVHGVRTGGLQHREEGRRG